MASLSKVYVLRHRSGDETSQMADGDAALAGTCIKRLKAGETLHVEGDPALFCYQVIGGVIKEYNTLEDGRRQIADFYGMGEIFGISEHDVHLHTAEAISESTVRCFPREALERASSTQGTPRVFFDALVSSLHRARERMIMLGRMSASQRVAAFLMRRAEEQGTPGHTELPMSRQDIADHLGLTIETVCRSLTEMKKQGLISMPTARQFAIADKGGLEEVARGVSRLV